MIKNPAMFLIDVDGTLVDSVPDLAWCVDAMMRELKLPERGKDAVRHWVGNGVPKLVERALTNTLEGIADPEQYDKAYPLFLEIYAENTSKRSVVYEGVFECLDHLKAKGYQLGCVTNKAEQFTFPILKELKLADYFEVVVAGDTLEKKKPDPLPLLHAAKLMGVSPESSIMIGDSKSDVKAARAAGFGIICMTYGYNHGEDIHNYSPDLVIDSMAELIPLFDTRA